MNNRLEKSLVGACGVFHVSAELSYRGWVTMPTIRNTKGIDIIATRDGKSINIQVKTNSYGKAHYPLGKENESLTSDDLHYVFVTLKSEKERPDFYIFPSKFVANYIRKTHDSNRSTSIALDTSTLGRDFLKPTINLMFNIY